MTSQKSISQRVVVLDVFRGMTLFLMIVVNTPGSGTTPFSPLLHAQWNGFTLTDLVFPSFLFAVGNAMAFSLQKYSGSQFVLKVIRRTVLIFLIGLFLNWFVTARWIAGGGVRFTEIQNLRIMGVLQRIALCYFFAAWLLRYISPAKVVLLCILFLAGYHLILHVFSLSQPYAVNGNAVQRLDLWLFNERHLYHERGMAFDPEGILSTMPALVNVIGGCFAGRIILRWGRNHDCVTRLLVIGNILVIMALLWNLSLPLNKKLWTGSFVLLTLGIDFAVVGMLMFLTDLRSITTGVYFFSVFGKNPLFIYILAEIFGLLLIIPVAPSLSFYDKVNASLYQKLVPGPLGSLLFAVSFALLCWVVAWVLDKYEIYVRI